MSYQRLKFDELPVTGFRTQLAVIPVNGVSTSYLRPETTVLKLREKLFSWSGDDCSIKVRIYEHKTCLILYFLLHWMCPPKKYNFITIFATYFSGSEWPKMVSNRRDRYVNAW